MKLRAKILPKYFTAIKDDLKHYDLRQMETITFTNTETGAEIELEIKSLERIPKKHTPDFMRTFPKCNFVHGKNIYKITLGKIIKPKEF